MKTQPYMITRVLYRDFCAAVARDPETSKVIEKYGKKCITKSYGTTKMYLTKGGAEVTVSIVHEKEKLDHTKYKNPYNKRTKTIKVRVYGVEKLANDGCSYSGIVYHEGKEVKDYNFDATSWMTEDDEEDRNRHEALRLLNKYEPDCEFPDFEAEFRAEEIIEKYKERETVPAGACAPACCRSAETSPALPTSVPAERFSPAAVPADPAVVPVKSRARRSRRRLAQRAHFPRSVVLRSADVTAQRKDWRYQLPRARPCGSTSIASKARGCAVLSSSPFGFISIGVPCGGTGMKVR